MEKYFNVGTNMLKERHFLNNSLHVFIPNQFSLSGCPTFYTKSRSSSINYCLRILNEVPTYNTIQLGYNQYIW